MSIKAIGLALLAAGCASVQAGTISADLRSAEGRSVARASAAQANDGLQLTIQASGLPAGTYAAHIHTTGRCDAPEFTTAGGHWNPIGRAHGRDNPQGAHMGDLPNLTVGADGIGSVAFTVAGARLRDGEHPVLDADGAAVVIHAAADDYRTDPSGNSGARIACGVLQ